MTKTKIVLVGRGGSGKDYLRKKMMERGMKFSVSYTSRPPREGEVQGKDYKFTTKEFFEEFPDSFYECIKFNGWYYGTLKSDFEKDDLFIMTPGGIKHIKSEDRRSCFIIYLNPPEEVIKKRLEERKGMADSVERRIAADNNDFADFTDYDMMVTNSDF